MSLSRETSVALIFESLIGFWPNSIIIFLFFVQMDQREKSHWSEAAEPGLQPNTISDAGQWGLIEQMEMSWSPADAHLLGFLHRPLVVNLPQRSLWTPHSGSIIGQQAFTLSNVKHHVHFVHLQLKNRKAVVLSRQLCSLVLSQACQKSCSTAALLCSPHSALLTFCPNYQRQLTSPVHRGAGGGLRHRPVPVELESCHMAAAVDWQRSDRRPDASIQAARTETQLLCAGDISPVSPTSFEVSAIIGSNQIIICSKNPILHLQFMTTLKESSNSAPAVFTKHALDGKREHFFQLVSVAFMWSCGDHENNIKYWILFQKVIPFIPQFSTQGDWNHTKEALFQMRESGFF